MFKGVKLGYTGRWCLTEKPEVLATALDHVSGGHLGTFGEITWDDKNFTLLSL